MTEITGGDPWDEFGRPRTKQPDCPFCGEDEIGSLFDRAWCHRCAWSGTLTELLRIVAEADGQKEALG